MRRKILRGFTLIEVVIVMAIIGILAAIAYPSYVQFVRDGRRTEAEGYLLNIELQEEKYRARHTTYGDMTDLGYGADTETMDRGYYTVKITQPDGTTAYGPDPISYTIVATALGDQVHDKRHGTSCSTLTVSKTNAGKTRTPADCW